MSENDSEDNVSNEETESSEQESNETTSQEEKVETDETITSELQPNQHETKSHEEKQVQQDDKLEETTTHEPRNDITQKNEDEIEETPAQKVEETPVQKMEGIHLGPEEGKDKVQVKVEEEKEITQKIKEMETPVQKIEETHSGQEEGKDKVQVKVEEEKVQVNVEEEKAQVKVEEEKVQVNVEEEKVQVKVEEEKAYKEEAEEKAQVNVLTEKVQEQPEKKETHQENEPEAKQHQNKRGKKDSASPEKGKPKPKRLLEERQPMTARYSGVMMTARDAREVPVTSREVTREERGEKELAGWEITQKKAFTHWINSYLMSRNLKIEELGNDFRSGVLLIRFLECLTGQAFEQKYHTNPKLRVHSLENAQLSLKYLRNIKVPDITIGPEEIVDGNIKMMLGFCWILLRHFGKQQMQRDRGDKNDNTSFEDSILNWVRDEIRDYNVDISSFKTSFNDGRALLALCHKFNPGCIDYENTDLSSSHTNVENALRLIEQQYNVPALLHVEDLTAGKESDKNIVLYLSLLHGAWRREMEKKKVTEVTEERVVTLQEKLTILEEERKTLKEEHSELEEKVEFLKKKLVEESVEKVEMKETKEQESKRIASEKEELRKAKEKFAKETSDLANENEQILQRLRRDQKAREALEEAVKKEQAKFVAMEFLRKNIVEHLRDIDMWKEFLEKDRNFNKEPVKLLQEDELKNKPPEGQLEALNQAVLEENKRLERILEEREKEKEIEKKKKSPRSPREPSSPRKGKSNHQRVASTTVTVATKNERKSEIKKKT